MPDPISPTKSGGVAHYRNKKVTPNEPWCGQIKADDDTWAAKLADITCPACIKAKGAEDVAEAAMPPRQATPEEAQMLAGLIEAGLSKATSRICYAYRRPPAPREAIHPVAVQTVAVLERYQLAAIMDHPLTGLVVTIAAMGVTIAQLPTIEDQAELDRVHGRPASDEPEADAAAA
jgi:hypothetical protein